MDRVKFQAFRHMDGHEGYLTLGGIHLLVTIRQEGNILKERVQSRPRMFFIEFADGVNHFVHVADTLVCRKFIVLP